MSRLLLASVLAATLAACGGKSSSPAPVAPLPPEETAVEDKKPEPAPEPVVKEPEPPPQPTTITVPAEPVTVKLLKPGKGKKAAIGYTLTAGAKHAFETSILVESSAGPNTTIMPKMVLGYGAEVLEVGADGTAKVRIVLDSISFQDVPGQTIDVSMIEGALGTLKGLTAEYTIGAQGIPGDQVVTFPAGAEADPSMMQQIVPPLVALPTEKVGTGATWEVVKKGVSNFTADVKTVYTLKSRKGTTATVELKTSIKGEPQKYTEGGFTADVTKLEGDGKGTIEVRTDWPVSLGAVEQDVSIGLSFDGQAIETRSKTSMATAAK
jgi:hypothetical protein